MFADLEVQETKPGFALKLNSKDARKLADELKRAADESEDHISVYSFSCFVMDLDKKNGSVSKVHVQPKLSYLEIKKVENNERD